MNGHRILTLVIIPSVPSEPTNNYVNIASCLYGFNKLIISPDPVTNSIPYTYPLNGPYLTYNNPPAFVAVFPPIKQLPFAPRSNGISFPLSYRYSSTV